MKTFGAGKPYEEFGVCEISELLLVSEKISEVEGKCLEMNTPRTR